MKKFHIIPVIFLIFIIPNAFAQSTEDNAAMFGKIPEQTVLIEISASGSVHITHDVERDSSTRYVEFVKGNVSNIEVYDKNGEDVLFGQTSYGEIQGIQILGTLSDVEVEYDLTNKKDKNYVKIAYSLCRSVIFFALSLYVTIYIG